MSSKNWWSDIKDFPHDYYFGTIMIRWFFWKTFKSLVRKWFLFCSWLQKQQYRINLKVLSIIFHGFNFYYWHFVFLYDWDRASAVLLSSPGAVSKDDLSWQFHTDVNQEWRKPGAPHNIGAEAGAVTPDHTIKWLLKVIWGVRYPCPMNPWGSLKPWCSERAG